MRGTISYSKEIGVNYEYDVAVIGAGIAGICAAISAARTGARVILLERFGTPGGNATTGGVASFCGNTVGQGEVFDMIVESLAAFGAIAPLNPEKSSRVFNHEYLAVILQELLLKNGVKLLLHSKLSDVVAEDGSIKYCIFTGAKGLEAVKAKVFIDCSGSGEIALDAGFSVMKGGDNGYQLPMSLMFFVRHVSEEENSCEIPEGWFEKIASDEELPMTSVWPNGPHSNAIKIKVPMFDSTDTENFTAAEVQGRRKMMSVMDYIQRGWGKKWIFDHCSPMIGVREGVRIVGDYILTVDDLRKGRSFADSIGVGTFYLDGHKTDDDKRTYILPKDSLGVPPYDIPMRILIARDCKNLLMAGRCVSADQLALSSLRVMTSCAMMGQASGIWAALASEKGCEVREIPTKKVQALLLERGAILDKEKVKQVYRAKE